MTNAAWTSVQPRFLSLKCKFYVQKPTTGPNMTYNSLSIDIEALGGIDPKNDPYYAVVLSIGATWFDRFAKYEYLHNPLPVDTNDLHKSIATYRYYYRLVSIEDQVCNHGRVISDDVVEWWHGDPNREESYKQILSMQDTADTQAEAVGNFLLWVNATKPKDIDAKNPPVLFINGLDYDFPILTTMFSSMGEVVYEPYWSKRDVRSLRNTLTDWDPSFHSLWKDYYDLARSYDKRKDHHALIDACLQGDIVKMFHSTFVCHSTLHHLKSTMHELTNHSTS